MLKGGGHGYGKGIRKAGSTMTVKPAISHDRTQRSPGRLCKPRTGTPKGKDTTTQTKSAQEAVLDFTHKNKSISFSQSRPAVCYFIFFIIFNLMRPRRNTRETQSIYERNTVKPNKNENLLTISRICDSIPKVKGCVSVIPVLENEIPADSAIAIRYNKNYPVVMANKLIRARKDRLTTLESKLLRLAISNIVELDTKLNTYTISVSDLADFLGVDSSNIYREVPQIAKTLIEKKIYMPIGTYDRQGRENFEVYNWVSYIRYENGVITLRLNDSLKPYLLGLDSLFTKYGYDNILSLPSDICIVLFELLISFEGLRIYNIQVDVYPDVELEPGEFVFPIDSLRKFLECEDKYPNTSDFIKWVIDYNLNIIMKETFCRIKYRTVKKGRSIKYIVFKFVGWLEDKELEQKISKLKLKAGTNNG